MRNFCSNNLTSGLASDTNSVCLLELSSMEISLQSEDAQAIILGLAILEQCGSMCSSVCSSGPHL